MPSLTDLLQQGDRHPKAEQSSESLLFNRQQAYLSENRFKVYKCDVQCRELEAERWTMLGELLNRCHVASWVELYPVVEIITRTFPPADLGCFFGFCADGTTVSPTNIMRFSTLICDHLWTLSTHIRFTELAETDRDKALCWHANNHYHFDTKLGATVEEVFGEINRRRDELESKVLGDFLWLRADAISFLPEDGKPEKGWADARRFFRALQRLPVGLRSQLEPFQLLIAFLPKQAAPQPNLNTTMTNP